MLIEICGTGCPRCQATEKNAIQALKELGMKMGEDAAVAEVRNLKQISARGVIITPAVVIDGVKVCEGRIPSAEEMKKWIKERK